MLFGMNTKHSALNSEKLILRIQNDAKLMLCCGNGNWRLQGNITSVSRSIIVLLLYLAQYRQDWYDEPILHIHMWGLHHRASKLQLLTQWFWWKTQDLKSLPIWHNKANNMPATPFRFSSKLSKNAIKITYPLIEVTYKWILSIKPLLKQIAHLIFPQRKRKEYRDGKI